MAVDLTKYGITGVTEILHNPSYEVLFAEENKPELEGFEKGKLTELNAMNVMTGIYTGRSPKDKYIVMDAFCGANKDTRMAVRFIMEVAWQAHFVKNMFIQPSEEELAASSRTSWCTPRPRARWSSTRKWA